MNIVDEIKRKLSETDYRSEGLRKKDLAAAMGVHPPAITAIIKGMREIKAKEIPIMAKFFGIPYDEERRAIPVVGYVGAGYEIFPYEDIDPFDEIDAPPEASSEAAALIVKGDSMIPVYYDGDYIIYDKAQSWTNLHELVGRECVVKLTDGRMAVKVLINGTVEGRWTLFSYNAQPISNVELEWIAPVTWAKRSRRMTQAVPA